MMFFVKSSPSNKARGIRVLEFKSYPLVFFLILQEGTTIFLNM